MMGTTAAAAPATPTAPRLPALAQATKELKVHGVAECAQWRTLLDKLATHVRIQDGALAGRRKNARTWRLIGSIAVLLVAAVLGWQIHVVIGVIAAIVGIGAVFWIIKLPKPTYIGSERIDFVRRLVEELGAIAPDGRIGISAHIDCGHGVPAVALPSGSANALERGEREDAWLRGSLYGIPGLRVSWQATEWRTATLRRRRNPRGKVKTKAKHAFATRLSARLDADRTLYVVVPAKAPLPKDQGVIDVRDTGRGYCVRGWRERSAKAPLGSMDVLEGLAELREKGAKEWFGDPPASLMGLMRLCEARLAPRTAAATEKT